MPVVIHTRYPHETSREKRSEHKAELSNMPFSVKGLDFTRQVKREVAKSRERPRRVSTREAFVTFFNLSWFTMAYHTTQGIVNLFAVREATPVEVRTRASRGELDGVSDDTSYQNREEKPENAVVKIVHASPLHVETDEYYDREQHSVDWYGPDRDGVVIKRVFKISHHVSPNVSVERRYELQTDLDGHQDHEYDPVVFVFRGDAGSMASYRVDSKIYLLHPPSLRLRFLFKNTHMNQNQVRDM